MNSKQIIGIVICLIIFTSCFFNWAYYPDIQEYFKGFYSKNNYYGKPGLLITILTSACILFYSTKKTWGAKMNMLSSALLVAYGITCFLRYTTSYDGYTPEKQPAIWVMFIGILVNFAYACIYSAYRRVNK